MNKILALRISEEDVPELLEGALDGWSEGDKYARVSKWGELIDRLTKYLPSYVKQSPTNTLYRFVAISSTLLKQVKLGRKQAILRNRKYSSWTYDLQAAKHLGELMYRYKFHNVNKINHIEVKRTELTAVILKRTFSNDQILLNLNEAYEYLGQQSSHEDEFEIIVKNANKDYKFTAEDIYLYAEDGKWKNFASANFRKEQKRG